MKNGFKIDLDNLRKIRNTHIPFMIGKKIAFFGIGLYFTNKLTFLGLKYVNNTNKELESVLSSVSTIISWIGIYLILFAIISFMTYVYDIIIEATEDVF